MADDENDTHHDGSHDAQYFGTPSSAVPMFPLLQLSSNRHDIDADGAGSSYDSIPPLPFGGAAFPSLNLDSVRAADGDNGRDSFRIQRPVAIRPSAATKDQPPSLQFILDDDDADGNTRVNHIQQQHHPLPTHVPQLRIKPVFNTTPRRDVTTPSPLARRGAEERKYLEGQLRAEAMRRQDHEQHNEDRKMRQLRESQSDHSSESDVTDVEIQNLMDKFNLGFGNGDDGRHVLDQKPNNLKYYAPKNVSRGITKADTDNIASSPPLILQKQFRRSVSAVLADSRSKDEEDDFVLFFPDGLPLLDENRVEGEDASRVHERNLSDCLSFDEKCSLGGDTNGGTTQDSTPFGTTSCHSTPSVDVLTLTQPVLGGNYESNSSSCEATFTIGGGLYNETSLFKGNKKVTLRPKMTVRPKTSGKSPPSDITTGEDSQEDQSSEGVEGGFQLAQLNKLSVTRNGNRLKVLSASDSFQQLSLEGRAENIESMRIANATTPLNSNRSVSFNMFKGSQDSTTRVLDYSSPDFSQRLPHYQLGRISIAATTLSSQESNTIKEDCVLSVGSANLKEPLSESNYHTPDHGNGVSAQRKQFGIKLATKLSTLPELLLPSLADSHPDSAPYQMPNADLDDESDNVDHDTSDLKTPSDNAKFVGLFSLDDLTTPR
jgi:hypothetical protein